MPTVAVNALSPYLQRVQAAHAVLGIPADYLSRCTQPLCEEPPELVATETDYYGRPQQLTPAAFAAWSSMKQAARADGVEVFLISAFRSVQYQTDLIARKLEKGLSLSQILAVNAAPGFSEHHTGRALDLGTSGCEALVESFENTKAFQWLNLEAGKYGFTLSYPRNNPWGIDYEPWHWCFEQHQYDIEQP